MLKIIHISDIHFGAKLGNFSQTEEINQALYFILKTVKSKNIDVLLIAGDIFDKSNPSAEAENSYFSFLQKLSSLNIITIIISGNHDNDIRLNAPQELLSRSKIYIFSSLNVDLLELEINNNKISFLPIPYFSEEKIREKILNLNIKIDEKEANYNYLYFKLLEYLHKKADKNSVKIALGHLFVRDSELTGSELPIQRGNLDSVEFGLLKKLNIDYFAFGHIHKFQKITENAYYSGSIVPISIDENKNKKQLILVKFSEEKNIDINLIEIPQSSSYIQLAGTFELIKSELHKNIPKNSFISVEFVEKITYEQNNSIDKIIKEKNLRLIDKTFAKEKESKRNFDEIRQNIKNHNLEYLFKKYLDFHKYSSVNLKEKLISKFTKIYEN
jgi:exonuclease SbcD